MPIIDHRTEPQPEPVDGRETRRFVTKGAGAVSLTIRELVMHDGAAHLSSPGGVPHPPPPGVRMLSTSPGSTSMTSLPESFTSS